MTTHQAIAVIGALLACGDYNPPDARVIEVLACQTDPGGPISRGGTDCRVRANRHGKEKQLTVCGVVAANDCITREGPTWECWRVDRECYCNGGC